MQIQPKQSQQRRTAETTEEQKQSGTGKTTAANYRQSVAASYRTEAATSFCNRLQMRRHYKAMLMRPASAPWDYHPRSVNSNLSSNVHLRAWRGIEEAERNNNQHLPPSCLHETFRERGLFTLSIVFTFTCFLLLVRLSSNTTSSSLYVTKLSANTDEPTVKELILLKTKTCLRNFSILTFFFASFFFNSFL